MSYGGGHTVWANVFKSDISDLKLTTKQIYEREREREREYHISACSRSVLVCLSSISYFTC